MSKKRRMSDPRSSSAHYPSSLSQSASMKEAMTTGVFDDDSLRLCLSSTAVRPKLSVDKQHTASNSIAVAIDPSSLSQSVSMRETVTTEVFHDDGLGLRLSPWPGVRPKLSVDKQNTASNSITVAIEHSQVEEVNRINVDYLLLQPPSAGPLPPLPTFYFSELPPGDANRAIATPSSSNIRQEKPARARRNSGAASVGKEDFVLEPFPWATNRRAHVHSLSHLIQSGIHAITGEVQCKRCEARYEIEYPLCRKFEEIREYIARNKATMHDRAPAEWMNPALPSCRMCQQPSCVKPVSSQKKRCINWLFLLLGGMLGCCTLEQLKYFCKHTNNHRTGAKDRVLYLTYLGLCKQLAGGRRGSSLSSFVSTRGSGAASQSADDTEGFNMGSRVQMDE